MYMKNELKKTRSLGLSVFATNAMLWISHMPMIGMIKMKCIKNGLVFLQMSSKNAMLCNMWNSKIKQILMYLYIHLLVLLI
jgi:hypothetical protein